MSRDRWAATCEEQQREATCSRKHLQHARPRLAPQLGRASFGRTSLWRLPAALELLVHHRVSGLPVVDNNNVVLGVVSDFDLLSLDLAGGWGTLQRSVLVDG